MAYRIYVSDCLRMITESSAFKEGDPYMQERWYDLISGARKKPDTRTGDEIVADVIQSAGIEVIW